MRFLHYILIFCLLVLTNACIEVADVSLNVENPKLVVEGEISNEAPPYQVRLSYTGVFHSSNYQPYKYAVMNAQVIIEDDLGNKTKLKQDPYDAFYYATTDSSFVGVVGRKYWITVSTPEGKVYKSVPETLLKPAPITAVSHEYVARFGVSKGGPTKSPEGYVLDTQPSPDGYKIYINTSAGAGNASFFKWSSYGYSLRESQGVLGCPEPFSGRMLKTIYNFCWVRNSTNQINIASTNGTVNNSLVKKQVYISPIYTYEKHYISITQSRISQEAYNFYRLYDEQSKRNGTILDPLPAPIIGNIYEEGNASNYALGYFLVAGKTTAKYIIDDKTITPQWIDNRYKSYFLKPGDCRSTYGSGGDGNCIDAINDRFRCTFFPPIQELENW